MSKPKILFFDIETAPNLAYVWGKYEQDVIAFKSEWHLLSVAYKWQGESQVHCITMEGQKSDKKLAKKLRNLFNEADIVIAHNGDAFDIKKAKARFVFHGLKPPSKFATVDTYKVSKRYFNFNSNKLNDLGQYLKVGEKVKHTGFDLWLGCMRDDKASWGLLKKYNMQDVILLERVYNKLLPWMERHPNVALLQDRDGCPKCGSTHVHKDGLYANSMSLQQRWKCQKCGGKFITRLKK